MHACTCDCMHAPQRRACAFGACGLPIDAVGSPITCAHRFKCDAGVQAACKPPDTTLTAEPTWRGLASARRRARRIVAASVSDVSWAGKWQTALCGRDGLLPPPVPAALLLPDSSHDRHIASEACMHRYAPCRRAISQSAAALPALPPLTAQAAAHHSSHPTGACFAGKELVQGIWVGRRGRVGIMTGERPIRARHRQGGRSMQCNALGRCRRVG